MDDEAQKFYIFGPNNNLIIFGVHINSYTKYSIVIVYCFINSLIRSSYNDVLRSWLTNSIQDIKIQKKPEITFFAYEVTYVTTIYNWFDWYIYMNILLAQVDMLIVEITSDLIMSGLITRYYLNYEMQDEKSKELEEMQDEKSKELEEMKELEEVFVEKNEIALNINEILV